VPNVSSREHKTLASLRHRRVVRDVMAPARLQDPLTEQTHRRELIDDQKSSHTHDGQSQSDEE
jgi:hypothetical protein